MTVLALARRDWSALRDEYVIGTESVRELAERVGIPFRTIRAHAQRPGQGQGKTWADLRADHRAKTSAAVLERAGRTLAERRTRITVRALDVAERALDRIADRLGGAAKIPPGEIIAIARLGLTMTAALKIDAGEKTGPARPLSVRLDEMTLDELRRLAA